MGSERPSTAGRTKTVNRDYINSRIPGMKESIRPYWQNVAAGMGPNDSITVIELGSENRSPVSGDWEVYEDPMSSFYESQAAYLEQMAAMQEAQMLAMQQAALSQQEESEKDASDYEQTNPDDTKRKQLLRRGLMSTFTRYPENRPSGGRSSAAAPAADKAAKLGG